MPHPRPVMLDGCCGAGGATRGYIDAGFCVRGVDSDARLERDYLRSGAIGFCLSDILAALGDVHYVRFFDFVHVSPPCFAAGTPVLTRRGSVSIEDICAGDEVWTHKNRWRPVTATMSRESPTMRIGPVTTTPDHPFLAMRKTTTGTLYSPSEGKLPRGRRPARRSPEWVPAGQAQGLFLASPLTVSEDGPAEWPCDPWLAGRYVADGWTGRDGLMIAVGAGKRAEFDRECGKLPWRVSTSAEALGCYRYTVADHALASWLHSQFGHSAAGKTLPAWLLGAGEPGIRQRFLAGYLSGDGTVTASGWRANTISAHLACQLRLLALSLGYASQIRKVSTPDLTVIDGRTVNQRDYWAVSIHRNPARYGLRQDGKYWSKQRKPVVHSHLPQTVYDLTVEEDHSFTAWGYVVHNCQHYSQMSRCRPGLAKDYPDLIGPVRELLLAAGVPYVIENVAAARPWLKDPVTLCGQMFGKPVYRHRLFEAGNGITLTAPVASPSSLPSFLAPPNHECGWPHPVPAAKAGHWKPGMYVSVSGHERKEPVREAMAIDWMRNRDNVAEAIPPYMTEFLGRQILAQL